MIPLGPVVARNKARASRVAVWAYLVDPEYRAAWWPELHLDPRLGGEIAERWTETHSEVAISRDASGNVDVWVDGHAIGFRWREAGDEHPTAVLLTLRSQGTDTGITVTETGFDVLPAPAERAAASQDGWQVLLNDFVAAVESAIAAGEFAAEQEAAEQEAAAQESAVQEAAEPEPAEPEVVEPEFVDEVAQAEMLEGDIDAFDDINEHQMPIVDTEQPVESGGDALAESVVDAEPDADMTNVEVANDAAEADDQDSDPATEQIALSHTREDQETANEPDFDDLIRGTRD